MRLVLCTKDKYTVYEDRKAIAMFQAIPEAYVHPKDIEDIRIAVYPPLLKTTRENELA